jgi:hypothetical protein
MSDNQEVDQYKVAIELILYEGNRLWHVFYLYLITHTLLLGLPLSSGFNEKFFGYAGILLCIPWMGAYSWHSWWYFYRIRDAKIIEKKLKWNFLSEERKRDFLSELLRPGHLTPLVIVFFSLIYLNVYSLHYLFYLIPSIIALWYFYLRAQWKRKMI